VQTLNEPFVMFATVLNCRHCLPDQLSCSIQAIGGYIYCQIFASDHQKVLVALLPNLLNSFVCAIPIIV